MNPLIENISSYITSCRQLSFFNWISWAQINRNKVVSNSTVLPDCNRAVLFSPITNNINLALHMYL